MSVHFPFQEIQVTWSEAEGEPKDGIHLSVFPSAYGQVPKCVLNLMPAQAEGQALGPLSQNHCKYVSDCCLCNARWVIGVKNSLSGVIVQWDPGTLAVQPTRAR